MNKRILFSLHKKSIATGHSKEFVQNFHKMKKLPSKEGIFEKLEQSCFQ